MSTKTTAQWVELVRDGGVPLLQALGESVKAGIRRIDLDAVPVINDRERNRLVGKLDLRQIGADGMANVNW